MSAHYNHEEVRRIEHIVRVASDGAIYAGFVFTLWRAGAWMVELRDTSNARLMASVEVVPRSDYRELALKVGLLA